MFCLLLNDRFTQVLYLFITESCPGELLSFTGQRGLFVEGLVSPPLAGVKVTVVEASGKMEPVVMETEESGTFRYLCLSFCGFLHLKHFFFKSDTSSARSPISSESDCGTRGPDFDPGSAPYSKTCVKPPYKNRQNKDLNDKL